MISRPDATHIVHELGFDLGRVGEEIHGSARVVPELYSPGTTSVRASIFATWTDIAAGYLALDAFAPRVPTTLELDVHLHQDLGDVRRGAGGLAADQGRADRCWWPWSTSPTRPAAARVSAPRRSCRYPTRRCECRRNTRRFATRGALRDGCGGRSPSAPGANGKAPGWPCWRVPKRGSTAPRPSTVG